MFLIDRHALSLLDQPSAHTRSAPSLHASSTASSGRITPISAVSSGSEFFTTRTATPVVAGAEPLDGESSGESRSETSDLLSSDLEALQRGMETVLQKLVLIRSGFGFRSFLSFFFFKTLNLFPLSLFASARCSRDRNSRGPRALTVSNSANSLIAAHASATSYFQHPNPSHAPFLPNLGGIGNDLDMHPAVRLLQKPHSAPTSPSLPSASPKPPQAGTSGLEEGGASADTNGTASEIAIVMAPLPLSLASHLPVMQARPSSPPLQLVQQVHMQPQFMYIQPPFLPPPLPMPQAQSAVASQRYQRQNQLRSQDSVSHVSQQQQQQQQQRSGSGRHYANVRPLTQFEQEQQQQVMMQVCLFILFFFSRIPFFV